MSLDGVARNQQTKSLADQLRDAVRVGRLPAGTRLPSSRTLAQDLGVSRGVAVRAYEQLLTEGYLEARLGSGTVVADVPEISHTTATRRPHPPTNPGLPEGGTFPRAAWARCAAKALSHLTDADFGYGDPAGLPALREELSQYLGRTRAVLAPPNRIIVVNGFGQATRLLADVVRASGTDQIAIEDPGSIGVREQLTHSGIRCVPIPVDDDGIRVDALATANVRAVIVTPAHQFPTGVVTSGERRHALLDWARATDSVIVEDDYDAELRYDRTPIGALQGLGPDVVLYGGSVSKVLAPGLRLGWMVVPERLVDTYVEAKYLTDLARGVIDQATMAEFLASGEMDRHIRRMTVAYRQRRDRLVSAVERLLPNWEVSGTAAGLHVVLHPDHDDDDLLAAIAQECGLDARPLRRYSTRPGGRTGLVVGYGHQRADALESAVTSLEHRLASQRRKANRAKQGRSSTRHTPATW
jgi:GntR family transcriptional regulator / MocR family aminotransferase